jgi:hypothetical protein
VVRARSGLAAAVPQRLRDLVDACGAAEARVSILRPQAAISWSGGKDCCLAMLRAWDTVDFVAMVTMFTEDGERTRSHGLRPEIVAAQGRRLGLEPFSARCSWPTYTEQYTALLGRLAGQGVSHVVFGDIIGATHREWNERVCGAHGLAPVMPLWAHRRIVWCVSSSRPVVRRNWLRSGRRSWMNPGWG